MSIAQPIIQKGKDYAWLLYVLVLALGVVYIYLTINAPTTQTSERLGLIGFKLRLVQITFIIPYIVTWFFGINAVVNLRRAQRWAQDSPTRTSYGQFALGILFVVSTMVIATLVGQLRNYHQENLSLVTFVTIFNNYIWAYLPFLGFVFLFRGVRRLVSEPEKKYLDIDVMSLIMMLLLGIPYSFLVFMNSTRQVSLDSSVPATYYLPDALIFATIIIPILATWFLGIRTAFMLGKVELVEYNEPFFTKFENSIWFITFALIILQAIISLGTERFYQIGLGPTLGILYLFLIVLIVGFGLLAWAVRKLRI